ncbi:GntR family transcriptional regulator [Nocardia nova]|uniref:GntR family transcriptional regulator n=1 Tax=Nocardia nova TaxID=37330 RepID=UPI00340B8DE0
MGTSQGERVYEQLAEEIIRGDLPAGTHLNEVRLAERLGVSRTPLREAVQRLTREGLARVTAGRGAFVSDIALADVVHLFQAREALETYLARLSARAQDREVFGRLRAEFESQRELLGSAPAVDEHLDAYYALIDRMDTAILHGTANPYLAEALGSLRGNLRRLRHIARRTPNRMLQTIEEHLAICRAIHDGNEELAAQATAVHVNNSLHNILGVVVENVGGTGVLPADSGVRHS